MSNVVKHGPPYFLRRFKSRYYSSESSYRPSMQRGPSYYHQVGKSPLAYRTIGQQLELCCHKYPEREGIVSVHEGKRMTFAQILDQSDRLAASFWRIGLERGDKIGIWAPNYIFWYISSLAAARAGLVSVGINPGLQQNEIEYCINKVDLKAIIAPESFKTTHYYEILNRLCPEVVDCMPGGLKSKKAPSLKSIIINSDRILPGVFQYEDLFNYGDAETMRIIKDRQLKIQPDRACNIQFTSGTTGLPKAAVAGHFGCVNNGIQIAERNELNQKHHKICVQVPLFHAYGYVVTIMASLAYGSTLVLPDASFNPKAIVNAIRKEACTVVHGTPTMYVDLIREIVESKVVPNTLEIAVTGGASCSPVLFKDIQQILNVKKVKTVFGQTEATAVACQSLDDESDEHVLHTIGHVLDHLEVKVIDRDGNVVPFGEPGELCIRGYSACLGYYGDPAKTKELIDEYGWIRTGDQFILREDGYGQIVGRLKEMVIRGGENIFPKEIEDFLNTHPSIIESHVIGVSDDRFGEELCAYIRLKDDVPDLTIDHIKTFTKGKIAHFKVPRYIRLVKDFPKTGSGKIQKFKLLEHFLESLVRVTKLRSRNN